MTDTAGYSGTLGVAMPAGGGGPKRAARLDLAIVRQQIANLLLQNPELADDDVLRADMIEGETDAFDLLRQVEAKRREALLMAAGIASTIAELEARLGRYERREQAMRRLAFQIMEAADLRKAEFPEATYSVRNGVQKVIVIEEAEIPEAYFRIKKELDKSKLGAALKSGEQIPGAILSNAESIISIRTK